MRELFKWGSVGKRVFDFPQDTNISRIARGYSQSDYEAMPYNLKDRNVLITGASRYTTQVTQ